LIGVGFLAVWTIVGNIAASCFLTLWRRRGNAFGVAERLRHRPQSDVHGVAGRARLDLARSPQLFFRKIFRVAERQRHSMFEFPERDGKRVDATPEASAADRK
jgi:hypothetical protein